MYMQRLVSVRYLLPSSVVVSYY